MSKQTKKTSERGEKELTAVAAGDEVDGIASAIYKTPRAENLRATPSSKLRGVYTERDDVANGCTRCR